MRVLVVDVGGTNVKMKATQARKSRRFKSGSALTPQRTVREVIRLAADWKYDAVALGYPGPVDAHGPTEDGGNLGKGWVGFDFEQAFGRPVRVVNDAVLQALGAYHEGRMLFLGLGTGLGSALVSERVIVPLELGCLPYSKHETIFERVGRRGRKKYGHKKWQAAVERIVGIFRDAFAVDHVVLGGGNAKHIDPLPSHTSLGRNDDAFLGGFRLWEEIVEPHERPAAPVWRVVK
jgi:polyphosphate glucokinase